MHMFQVTLDNPTTQTVNYKPVSARHTIQEPSKYGEKSTITKANMDVRKLQFKTTFKLQYSKVNLRNSGREFQSVGPVTHNALSANLVPVNLSSNITKRLMQLLLQCSTRLSFNPQT